MWEADPRNREKLGHWTNIFGLAVTGMSPANEQYSHLPIHPSVACLSPLALPEMTMPVSARTVAPTPNNRQCTQAEITCRALVPMLNIATCSFKKGKGFVLSASNLKHVNLALINPPEPVHQTP